MPVADHLNESTLTMRPERGRTGHWDLTVGGESMGRIGDDLVQVDDRRLRLVSLRGHDALMDTVTGATVATLQYRAHGSVAIAVGGRRFRLVREGVLPWFWNVTEDLGGPQILRMLRVGSLVRVRPGADADTVPAADLDLLLAGVAVAMLDVSAPVDAAA